MPFRTAINNLVPLVVMLMAICQQGRADWLSLPSTYTHDPSTGKRTDQYCEKKPSITYSAPNFQSSGYRQYRSTIQYAQAADNYHRVEKWGAPVRPYGEWRFPARPYSSPYPVWGAPLAGMNLGYGRGFGYPPFATAPAAGENTATGAVVNPGGVYNPYGPGGASLTPYPHLPNSPYPVPPYYDGYHPNYGEQPRMDDESFFYKPTQ